MKRIDLSDGGFIMVGDDASHEDIVGAIHHASSNPPTPTRIPNVPSATGWEEKDFPEVIPEKYKNMPWGEVGVNALKSAAPSTGHLLAGLASMVRHPIDSAKGAWDLAAGEMQNVLPESVNNVINKLDWNPEAAKNAKDMATSVNEGYARYFPEGGLKQKLSEDPAMVALDLSTLLSGGSAAATKAGLPGVATKMTTAAKYTNPLLPVAQALRLPGKAMKNVSSLASGVSKDVLSAGYNSAKAGDVTGIVENMRGNVSDADAVMAARARVAERQKQASQAYEDAKPAWQQDTTPLDVTPIAKTAKEALRSTNQGGMSVLSKAEKLDMEEIFNKVDEWSQLPDHNTLNGIDALKKSLDAMYPSSPKHKQVARVLTQLKNSVKQVGAVSEAYTSANSNYASAMSEISEITKGLGLKKGGSIASARNFLKSGMNHTDAYKAELLDKLVKGQDKGLSDALRGQILSSWLPKGRVRGMIEAGALGLAANSLGPWSMLVAGAASPRIAGEAAIASGKIAGKLNPIINTNTLKYPAFMSQQLQEQ